jgi:exopolysaccharide biosynthesis protein
MRLFIATIDLASPGLRVRVSPGGPDPDGPGAWETTLMAPTRIAARDGFDLTVNGDFFDIPPSSETMGLPSYNPGVWANVIGPAVSAGNAWSRSSKKRPCLIVRGQGRVSIEQIAKPPADAREVIAGNVMLVLDGHVVTHKNQAKHPRTVVGLNSKGTRLVILVVDGRRPGEASGMSYEQLAREMIRLGCKTAINLDGGGSSVMVLRDPATRRWRVLNQPSDGQERPVANVLGIKAGKAG